MTLSSQRNLLLVLELFVVLASCANLNYSGEALTTRYWDCCKPSCAWRGKASVTNPVGSCSADEKPIDVDAGTGCNGGTAYACSQQQPWAVNDTLSYGFAGVYLTKEIVGDKTEDAWCCACYQLDFTSEPLRGKSMIIQASNTAYLEEIQLRLMAARGSMVYLNLSLAKTDKVLRQKTIARTSQSRYDQPVNGVLIGYKTPRFPAQTSNGSFAQAKLQQRPAAS
ncbi:hypothetical protein E8E13_008789 [Curvularia kusanoi]|uniref:Cellulase n=1 Tax=Curvularia kusanoi TaxID=90978 RepID=A0A9P4TK61_CURKU|nr:hypothetical protein E8E13_008789 [Curvularia kusanoi]